MQPIFAQVSAEIEAEPDKLWEIVANFKEHPRLSGSGEVQAIRVVRGGPVTVGYEVESNQKVGPVRYKTRSKVIAAVKGRVLNWRSGFGDAFSPNHWKFSFDQLEPSEGQPVRTRVTHTYEFKPPLLNIFEPVIALVFQPRVDQNARGMRRTLENLARTAGAPPATNFKLRLSR